MLIYILLYFMFYYTLGSGILYFSQYFNTIGITGGQSGIIFALGSLVATGFQPFLGYINDKTEKTKELLILLMGMIFVSLFLMSHTISFEKILILYIIYAIAVFSKMPLMDAMSLTTNHTFGKIRLWGSIGFAVGGLVTGKVISVYGSGAFIYMGMLFSLLTILVIIRIPKTKGVVEKTNEKIDIKGLLKNKKYLLSIVVAMLVLGTNNGHNSYFSVYFEDIGGSMTLLGVTIFLMTLSEVPLIALSSKLVARKNAEYVVGLSALILGIRWGLYFLIAKPMLVTGSFFLQGASVGFFFGSANLFIKSIVKKNTLSTAIMIFMAAGSLGGMFVQYISGIMIENGSPVNIYALFSALAFVAYLLMFINKKMKNPN